MATSALCLNVDVHVCFREREKEREREREREGKARQRSGVDECQIPMEVLAWTAAVFT